MKFSDLMFFFFSPQGRVPRTPMFFLLGGTLFALPLIILSSTTLLEKIFFVGIFWLCPMMKRFHDCELESWWAFLVFLGPIASVSLFFPVGFSLLLVWFPFFIWAFIKLLSYPGTLGSNLYGPDPLEAV